MKEIPGYQVDEVAAVPRMASLGGSSLLPYKKTSVSFIQVLFINWLVNLSNDEGDTNENISWKYKIFYLCYFLALL